jgi:hypothetical protein
MKRIPPDFDQGINIFSTPMKNLRNKCWVFESSLVGFHKRRYFKNNNL